MCGICGILNRNSGRIDRDLLGRMNSALIHRGPDDEGYHISQEHPGIGAALAMRRLSIIDLDTGHQPIYNEDRSIAIVFNGEIYNFKELRKQLEPRHDFRTRSDTEVIIHLYEEKGEECLSDLRGMFAIAIWDSRKQELFIARDRLGQKPLYYTWIQGNFYFASEIKALLEVPGFNKNIDFRAIHYYLNYQYIPGPMTIWKDVKRLPKASYMIIKKDGSASASCYWDVDYRHKTGLDYTEAKERLRELLGESTRLRMISDVPLGVFLSGGHDSSIITGLMSEISDEPVKTFSIGFEEQEFSELEYARMIADRFGTEHHELVVKPAFIDIVPQIVKAYDQPYADCSALPTYYVAKMTRQHVKVALNGDAGDENFAGYLRYKALKLARYTAWLLKLVPGRMERNILGMFSPNDSVDRNKTTRYLHRFAGPLREKPAVRNLVWHAYFTNELKQYIYSDEMKGICEGDDSYGYLVNMFEDAPAADYIDRAMFTDLNAYLPENLNVKVDVATMMNSLEARSPFLDHKLVEFAATLPVSWKMKGLSTKYILKDTFRDYFPEQVMNRGKQGFSIPLGKWFRNDWKEYLKEILFSPRARQRPYFNFTHLEKIVDDHIEGRKDHGYCLWALMMLELWHNEYYD